MEQSEQIINSEPSTQPAGGKLPIKTKIAVWWVVMASVVGTIVGIVVAPQIPCGETSGECFLGFLVILILPVGLLHSLNVVLFIVKRKWAWIIATTMLSMGFLAVIVPSLASSKPVIAVCSLVYLIPLTLVVLDFKNYWTMASNKLSVMNRNVSGINGENI